MKEPPVVAIAAPLSPNIGMRTIHKKAVRTTLIIEIIKGILGLPAPLKILLKRVNIVRNPTPMSRIESDCVAGRY
jgi:hypothetical protein